MRGEEVACVNTAPPCGLHCRMTFTNDRTRCDDKKAAQLQPDDVLIRRGGGRGRGRDWQQRNDKDKVNSTFFI